MFAGKAFTCAVVATCALLLGCSATTVPAVGSTPSQSSSATASAAASSSAGSLGTQPLGDRVHMPLSLTALAPPSPFKFLGRVIGWTASFGLAQEKLATSLNDVTLTLKADGWAPGLDLSRNHITAVRHDSNIWEVLEVTTTCPAQAQGACIMLLLYVSRTTQTG
ncbi:MAG: hypothetical protein WCJ42_07850 [Actinomycetes bacterium]